MYDNTENTETIFTVSMAEYVETEPLKESKWVKTVPIRMGVFNDDLFENIYEGHTKLNAKMNYNYMEKTFAKLSIKAYMDESISDTDYFNWVGGYEENINKLHRKKLDRPKDYYLTD